VDLAQFGDEGVDLDCLLAAGGEQASRN